MGIVQDTLQSFSLVDIFQDNHIVKHKYMRAFITIVPVMFYVKHKIIYAVDRQYKSILSWTFIKFHSLFKRSESPIFERVNK